MLILQFNHIRPMMHYSNPGVKLREADGTLWEACSSLERREAAYDSIDQLHEIEIEQIMNTGNMTLEAFNEKFGPDTIRSFQLQGNERPIAIPMSDLLCSNAYFQIADGTCIPELVATDKKGDTMTADLFIKYKHPKAHDHDYDMTLYTSIRLTLIRVPEYK